MSADDPKEPAAPVPPPPPAAEPPLPWWRRTVTGKRPGPRRWTWRSTAGLILIIVIVDIAIGSTITPVAGLIVFGWIGFLYRLAGEWRWSAGDIAAVAALAGALLVGGHLFLRRLREGMGGATPWPWRWTLTFGALVLVMFGAGVATLGSIHQAAWIARDGILDVSRPYSGHSQAYKLTQPSDAPRMTADEARSRLQAALPGWRVVVIPDGELLGAIVLVEDRLTTRDAVIAVVDATPKHPRRLSIAMLRRTTLDTALAKAESQLASWRAGPGPVALAAPPEAVSATAPSATAAPPAP